MYHDWYANLRRQRQTKSHDSQIFTTPIQLQHQLPQIGQMNSPGFPSVWGGQPHQTGWWTPGGFGGQSGMGQPINGAQSINPTSFGTHGQSAGWGSLGSPVGWWGGPMNQFGWGSQGKPMSWGNYAGQGRPGIFGSIYKVGKGTIGGLGMLNNLVSIGKFLKIF